MFEEYAWFERAFTFDLPVWMYPNVVERLRGTPARLEELVVSLDASVLIWRDGEDWSIQENAGHLWDLESLWLGRLDDFLNGSEMLRVADLTNRKTYDANHNASTINAILAAFRRERGELVRHLDRLTESEVERTALHPRLLQPMRVLDHAFFMAEHDDHHLAQITRLKRKFSL